MSDPTAIVLLSGGLDSATTLAIAKSEGFQCHALSFCYGQRHVVELAAAERMASLATKAAVEGRQKLTIHAPLIQLTKAEIIRRGLALGVDYSLTSSCYDPDAEGRACGRCDSCLLRLKGFAENGVKDPIPYVTSPSH